MRPPFQLLRADGVTLCPSYGARVARVCHQSKDLSRTTPRHWR